MQKYWAVLGAREDMARPEYNVAGMTRVVLPSDAEDAAKAAYQRGRADAEQYAEEKARAANGESYRNGYRDCMEKQEQEIRAAVEREREEILLDICRLTQTTPVGLQTLIERVRSRGAAPYIETPRQSGKSWVYDEYMAAAPKRAKLEKLAQLGTPSGTIVETINALIERTDALVDAIESLRKERG